MRTVLIVDENLGFVFWLGQLLQDAGFTAFPARNASDGEIVVVDCALVVDIVILNLFMPGAADLIARLRRTQEHLKVIAIERPAQASEAHSEPPLPKLLRIDEQVQLKWILVAQRILSEVFA